MKIHIGNKISEVLKERVLSAAWLGRAMEESSRNTQNLLKRENVYTDQLLEISRILDVDFFKLFSEQLQLDSLFKPKEPELEEMSEPNLTISLNIRYPVSLSPDLGKFIMHVHALALNMGFDIV